MRTRPNHFAEPPVVCAERAAVPVQGAGWRWLGSLAIMRLVLKLVAWLGVIAVLMLIPLVLVAMRVPTAQDARASDQIRLDFTQAVNTNLPAEKHVSIISSPRRNGTVIFVSGASLTEEEEQRLSALAAQIGKTRDNRSVKVVFRDQ